ncbi:non-hemolytic enterotoxin subunit C [Bacillus gaemokensis]|uniref:Enterotoxin n=1 Tax=Bacillus gaemokensis TaxID=574375 RepID=A0A073KPH0_9BACI|nr:HBL/NHE enterotoxin family protein [Bacillus gaemokensis]KEK24278.1 enterotoxin [Bacillus gaemokensis]KYG38206.1 enterotoxin [Bacillus gaemokensis]
MNKKLYKKIALSMVIAGIATSNVIPHHTFAAEQTIQESNKQYSLGSEGFQDAMNKMASSTLVMDSYAQTIRNQQQTDLSRITSINGDLQANMMKHQKDAQTNATYWLNDIKPHIMKTNQNIVNYNDTFQSYYNNLLAAINQQNTVSFKNELEKLYHSILNNSQEVDGLLDKLKTFRNKMLEDTRSFKDDSNQLTSILESTNAGIPLLQKQIDECNYRIKQSNDMLIAGGVMIIFTFGASAAMIATAKSNISSAEQEIQNLKSRISGAQEELVILTDAKNKTIYMTDTIDIAITSLQNISNQWHTIGSKYNKLLQNVEEITPEKFAFLKEDLNTAKGSWQDIKNYADKLSEGTKEMKK